MDGALLRCQQRGHPVTSVIDVGASNGCWSVRARQYFPKAFFFLIEAQKAHEKSLRILKNSDNTIDFEIVAAGDTNGELFFDGTDLFGGAASYQAFNNKKTLIVPVKKIDTIVTDHGLKPPFLLKLDTHGFEIPIFNGAQETLKDTEIIIVEAYNFKLRNEPTCVRFCELCSFLEEKGFRCIDIVDLMNRKYTDMAFWQMDMVFVRGNRSEFEYNQYE